MPPYDEQLNEGSNYDESSNVASKPAELNSQQSSEGAQPLLSKNSDASQNPPLALSLSPSKVKDID